MRTLFLIDGHSYAYQVFYAIKGLSGPRGEPAGAVYGFISMLLGLLKKEKPSHLAVTFDRPEPSFRHERFDAYKATRKPMPEELAEQIPVIQDIVRAYGLPVFTAPGFEADDVIATAAAAAPDEIEVLIISRDKDLKQILGPRVSFYDTRTAKRYSERDFVSEYGFAPALLADYLGIAGDPSDNIPGVKGIGPKGARELVGGYGALENIYAHLDEIPKRMRNRLEADREAAFLSRELATVRRDVPLEFSLDACALEGKEPDRRVLKEIFQRYNFRRFMEELTADSAAAAEAEEVRYVLVDTERKLEDCVRRLAKADRLAVDTETTCEDEHAAELVGISMSAEPGTAFYLPVRAPEGSRVLPLPRVIEALRPLLEGGPRKICQNGKYDYIVLKRHGLVMRPLSFDTMIAAHLLDPSGRGYSLDALAMRYLDRKNIPIEDLIGKGKSQTTMDTVDVEKVCVYSCEDADVTFRLADVLGPALKEKGLWGLFEEVEMPLVEVLAEMQMAGVAVDTEYLAGLAEEIRAALAAAEKSVHEAAGRPFEVNSPKQLGEVLFGELGLPVKRKTRTGQPSTDHDVLVELASEHPLPAAVLEYRTLSKMLSTYVEALPRMVGADGRIHTSFNQTATATGRLSSSEPNLQNIPVRDEWGKKIRRAFVPSDGERFSLLSADYSQVELRLLAHFSGEPALVAAFERGEDIHRSVAADVFGVAPSEVTPEQRRHAKVVNFGIVYGLTPHGLAAELKISHAQAKDFIDAYFRRYPKVREFTDALVDRTRKDGCVRTIAGRLRYISGLDSTDPSRRAAAERLVLNTLTQGSAADLIKKAMIALHGRLAGRSDARMILQIHDELLFEVADSVLDDIKYLVTDCMCGTLELRVPLSVDIGIGKNWADLK